MRYSDGSIRLLHDNVWQARYVYTVEADDGQVRKKAVARNFRADSHVEALKERDRIREQLEREALLEELVPAAAKAPLLSKFMRDQIDGMLKSGVIEKTCLVYGQMNEPPGARLRVGLAGLTTAEYFRDQGQDVLLFIDNIFRFSQAGSEVSALLGRMPSAVGYQPTLATEMGDLQERITSTKEGSITSVQAIYVPADDLTDPAPATTFTHLDATTVLSRAITELGIYPAVDPLASSSDALDPAIVGEEHYRVAAKTQEILQEYSDLQDIIAILGMDELTEEQQRTVSRARKVQQFLSQSFHVAEKFTGNPGVYCRVEDTVRSFAAIVDGECDDIPEQAFRYASDIEDVRRRAAAMETAERIAE